MHHYVLQKMVSNKEAKSIIGKFKLLVETYELNEKILELAIHNDTFNDFEAISIGIKLEY